jgi:hypothetical protein
LLKLVCDIKVVPENFNLNILSYLNLELIAIIYISANVVVCSKFDPKFDGLPVLYFFQNLHPSQIADFNRISKTKTSSPIPETGSYDPSICSPF